MSTRKSKSNMGGLLDGLHEQESTESQANKNEESKVTNPILDMAEGATKKRADSVKEPVLKLEHDQVIIFKYHDRHDSSLQSIEFQQLKKSIETDGQDFPGVVRKTELVTDDNRVIYELIVGRLRFEASRSLGVFKAFLKELDDVEATKLMLRENEGRKGITRYERWLSVIPLLNDQVLSITEIATYINMDRGNLSKTMDAVKMFMDLSLEKYLLDVNKVKMDPLVKLSKMYIDDEPLVANAVDYIASHYPARKNNLFIKSVIDKVKSTGESDKARSEQLYLEGSKARFRRDGSNLSITFDGLPKESDLEKIIASIKNLKGFRED